LAPEKKTAFKTATSGAKKKKQSVAEHKKLTPCPQETSATSKSKTQNTTEKRIAGSDGKAAVLREKKLRGRRKNGRTFHLGGENSFLTRAKAHPGSKKGAGKGAFEKAGDHGLGWERGWRLHDLHYTKVDRNAVTTKKKPKRIRGKDDIWRC